jgi:exodeoxyribonuclease VII small subunit
MAEAAAREVTALSYEEALGELEGLIRKLETGSIDLADSISSYERGVALANHCSTLLEQTETKVQRLVLGPQGQPREEPFDAGAEIEDADG